MQQKENINRRLLQTTFSRLANSKQLEKANDYVLKRYKLQQNQLFKPQNNEEAEYELSHTHNQVANNDVQDEFVIVPLEMTAQPADGRALQSKLQDQPIFVFDDQEDENNNNLNKEKQVDTTQDLKSKKIEQKHQRRTDPLQDNKEISDKYMPRNTSNFNKISEPTIHNKKHFFQSLNQLVNQQKQSQGVNDLKGAILRTDPIDSKQYIRIIDQKTFTLAPIPPNLALKFMIRKNDSIINMISPQFDLYLANGFDYVLTAKRYPFSDRQLFKFSSNPSCFNQSTLLGIMHANDNHNVYWLLDQPHRIKQLDLSILYLAIGYHIIRNEEPQRKFTVLVPSNESDYQLAMEYGDTSIQFSTLKQEISTRLTNLQTWQDQSSNSIKNFVLANPSNPNYRHLEMKKESENSFELTIRHPLSPLQGMAIAMTRFDVDLK